ncbi:thioredoxin family protein [Pedomonas mirosovicensis]|uniref:thioredoxin family protein n=1 Tax=Pedomonas mirosovicensis TaxID=2908641 RepID=UPI00216A0DE4|nr:thioredoxin family protein [Pedomonas mirosovicensis]MCH8685929.1 thioredoxin family protein [Pedomonas mirosovicensis]
MKPAILLSAFAVTVALSAPALAAPKIGAPAPAFTATDVNGKSHSLADYKGKTVVLEWNNPECPFVQKHYGSGNMQALQKSASQNGVVWLTINSSADGTQGNMKPQVAKQWLATQKAAPAAYLLDEKGTVGRLYEAKTTPHMYVIDPKGTLVYMGAIDDKPTANPDDIKTAKNYVTAALTSVKAGQPVADTATKPYGCSVKYK